MSTDLTADLGDLVIVLLASTLAGLRDRLADDNFTKASELVADSPPAVTPTSRK